MKAKLEQLWENKEIVYLDNEFNVYSLTDIIYNRVDESDIVVELKTKEYECKKSFINFMSNYIDMAV